MFSLKFDAFRPQRGGVSPGAVGWQKHRKTRVFCTQEVTGGPNPAQEAAGGPNPAQEASGGRNPAQEASGDYTAVRNLLNANCVKQVLHDKTHNQSQIRCAKLRTNCPKQVSCPEHGFDARSIDLRAADARSMDLRPGASI